MRTKKLWRNFLIEVKLARNYPHAPVNVFGPPFRNPILEQILPSLLHLKAVVVLDDAAQQLLENYGLSLPRKYPKSLEGRLRYLADQGKISGTESLKHIRDRRNDVAHEFEERVDWSTLDEDIAEIQSFLESNGLVESYPAFDFFAQRSKARSSDEPRVAWAHDHSFGLREDGQLVAEVRWTESIMKSGEG